MLDPDTGVQQAIRHVFTLFARTGSARATVQQFNADGLLFPVRVRTGTHKGELAWMPLQHWRVLRTLHNPRYAGAFAYGRRRERVGANGKKTFQILPREQWIALIRDAHPGYISWDQYETNQRLLLANATAHGEDRAAGPAREGTALLQGLAICGRCGRRMTVRYHTRRGVAGPRLPMHEPLHPRRRAPLPNRARRRRRRRRRRAAAGHPHPARARGRPDRSGRTGHPRRRGRRAAPPGTSNGPATAPTWPGAATWPSTPTTGSSPTAWKPTGTTRCAPCRPPARTTNAPAPAAAATLTDQIKNQIRSLATDFPALWSNPHTAQRDRKRMVRLLVDDVTLHKTDRIHLHVRLRGGQNRSLAVAIPPTSWQARQTRPDTVKTLDRLLDTHTDAEAAETLNAEGHRSGENKPFTAGIVVHVRRKYHLRSHADRLRAQGLLTTTELAQHLEVHPSTVKSWTKAGILNSHKANDKNERLYEPPTADDPRLTTRQGSPLRKRVPIQPTTGGAL